MAVKNTSDSILQLDELDD